MTHDIAWPKKKRALHNHHVNANALWYEALNDTPGRVDPPIEPPPDDIQQYWRDWMERDGHPFCPYWDNIRSWWAIRELPNILFVHFADLKRDMPGEMRRIASFLQIPVGEARWPIMVEHCSFEWMKANATKSVPMGGAFWDAGAEVFINKGVNGHWSDTLSPCDKTEYGTRALQELGRIVRVGWPLGGNQHFD